MRKHWNNLSIQKKAALILGIIVGSMWMLIISIEMQISHVARDSQQIMDDYMSVTAFGDAIDGEESSMDAFMRPSGGEIARKNLQDAAEKTDQSYAMLSAFIYSDHLDIRGIIHSIENSMDSYQSQRDILLHAQTTDEMVRSYDDLKRQIVYM
jgi:hypothetical protein